MPEQYEIATIEVVKAEIQRALEQRAMRIRVKIARSTKGIVTHEHTCEGDDRGRVLAESDRVYAELEARYPLQEG
jgi:hypothetical protein